MNKTRANLDCHWLNRACDVKPVNFDGYYVAIGVGMLGGILSNLVSSGYSEYGDVRIPGALGGALGVLGTWAGVLIIVSGVVGIYLAVQCFKRKSDLQRTTFPLVVGIIYSVFGLISVISAFNVFGLIGLFLSVSLLVGAILNKQQATAVGAGYAPPGYQPRRVILTNNTALAITKGHMGRSATAVTTGLPESAAISAAGYPNQPPPYGQPIGQPSYPQQPPSQEVR